MKKVKLIGKLSLGKETISKLTKDQMKAINGGDASVAGSGCSCLGSCVSCAGPTCPYTGCAGGSCEC